MTSLTLLSSIRYKTCKVFKAERTKMNFKNGLFYLIILLQLILGVFSGFSEITLPRRRSPKVRDYPNKHKNLDHMRGLG